MKYIFNSKYVNLLWFEQSISFSMSRTTRKSIVFDIGPFALHLGSY